ncbi:2-oxoglutarate-dependent dioxygenase 21, chloroplastic, partial [Cucurbita argyrosperma subsp. sororia]
MNHKFRSRSELTQFLKQTRLVDLSCSHIQTTVLFKAARAWKTWTWLMGDGCWFQKIDGALHVHVGGSEQWALQGFVHRATVNSGSTRITITSLHSLGMDEKTKPAEELVDEQNP